MNKPTIKILVAGHSQRCPVITTDILTPIQVGASLAPHLFPNVRHDNEGENISDQNLKYNELTAHYWAWKNQDKLGNPDYIGLMHDRRYFLFNTSLPIPDKEVTWLPKSPFYQFPPICKSFWNYVSDESIRNYFPQYDCMVSKLYDSIPRIIKGNMRDYFLLAAEMTNEIFDVWAQTVKELFPDYQEELEQFIRGADVRLCNMHVMRKDLFNEYSHFLFSILKRVDEQIDSSQFSVAKKRFLGYLGEFTLSVFCLKLQKRPGIRLAEMNGIFIMNATKADHMKCLKYWLGKTLLWGKYRRKYQQKYQQKAAWLNLLKFFNKK